MSAKTVFTCNYCSGEISGEYYMSRCLAVEDSKVWLDFQLWNEENAIEPGMMHFCTDHHAGLHLMNWLSKQREKQEADEATKAPQYRHIPIPGLVDLNPPSEGQLARDIYELGKIRNKDGAVL